MERDQLRTLAETFHESISSQQSFSIEQRESWLKGMSEFAQIIMEAAEALNKRDAALDRIAELAATSYHQLAPQDKLMGAGSILRSIMDIAAAAKAEIPQTPSVRVSA